MWALLRTVDYALALPIGAAGERLSTLPIPNTLDERVSFSYYHESFFEKCTEDSRRSNELIRSYDNSPLAAAVSRFLERASGPEEEAPVEECQERLYWHTGTTNEEIHRRRREVEVAVDLKSDAKQ